MARLEDVVLPPLSQADERPMIAAAEYLARIKKAHAAAGAEWLVVYADREHSANLQYLCGVDARFEELLLLIGQDGKAIAVAGNEMPDYVRALAPFLDVVLAQSFGLMGQDRTLAPRLRDALRDCGVRAGDRVAVVGWKYLTAAEADDPARPAFVPAMLVNEIEAAGAELYDATAVLMHPASGLRAANSSAQIAAFEWAAARSSRAVWSIVAGARPGMTEHQAAALMGYEGDPLSAHTMMSGAPDAVVGLRSPSDRVLQHGDAVTTAVGFQGGLTCRAGSLTRELVPGSLPVLEAYFESIASFWQTLAVGVTGGAIWEAATTPLARVGVRPALNPGHLISYEEWLNSPVAPASSDVVQSGAVFQSDIIPTPLPSGVAINCEDTIAVADEALRSEIARQFPRTWDRIVERRRNIADVIGLRIAPDLLPLSDRATFLAPNWLSASVVFTAR